MRLPTGDTPLATHAHLEKARKMLKADYRALSDILDRSRETFGEAWVAEFDRLLRVLFPTDELLRAAFRGYVKFSTDSMRLQAAFEKTGAYRGSSYAEASRKVYQNENYMMSEYLPGLLLSHYLWPHHYRQLVFFDQAFVRHLRDADVERFVEVGIGTGLYSRRLLEALPGVQGTGYDISPSVEIFVHRHLCSFGLEERYDVVLQDVTVDEPEGQAESLICVEVLEHLEEPVEFLCALRRMLAPGGKGFVTAAVSADHADHIYLYRTASDVADHLAEAGFEVEQSFVGEAYSPRYPGQPIPIAAAFTVS